METFLFEHKLCVLKEGNSPTFAFETRLAVTCIDITVATPALASLVTKWNVQSEMHLSDHHLITMELLLKPDKMPLRNGRNLKKVDWGEFNHLIYIFLADYQDPILWSPKVLDQTTQLLHNAIDSALDAVSPITPSRPKNATMPAVYAGHRPGDEA
jgi:hypothetical protein